MSNKSHTSSSNAAPRTLSRRSSGHRPNAAWRPRVMGIGILLLGAVLTGCAGSAPGTGVASAATGDDGPKSPLLPGVFFADGGERFSAWRCTPSQELVTTSPADDRLRLWTARGETELSRQASNDEATASYVRGGLSFARTGRDARVESDNARLVCTLAGTRDTVTRNTHPESIFYASGNEPGWNVSLDRQTTTLTLVSDYGQARDTFDYRVASVDNGADASMVLVSDSGRRPLEMNLRARACFDSMSGKPWPVEVTLRYGRQEWKGCGQGVEARRQ